MNPNRPNIDDLAAIAKAFEFHHAAAVSHKARSIAPQVDAIPPQPRPSAFRDQATLELVLRLRTLAADLQDAVDMGSSLRRDFILLSCVVRLEEIAARLRDGGACLRPEDRP